MFVEESLQSHGSRKLSIGNCQLSNVETFELADKSPLNERSLANKLLTLQSVQ